MPGIVAEPKCKKISNIMISSSDQGQNKLHNVILMKVGQLMKHGTRKMYNAKVSC